MEHLLFLLTRYGYLILFPLAIVEGPILSVLAGLLCSLNVLNPVLVVPVIVLGDVIGDSGYYGLGRWRSRQRPPHFLKRFIPSPRQVAKINSYFNANPIRTIFLAKVTLGIGLAGLYLAGQAKIPYQRFLLICLSASLSQCTGYVLIGMVFGSAYQRIGSLLDGVATGIILAALAAVLFFLIRSRRHQP